jgi:hypothetical protein
MPSYDYINEYIYLFPNDNDSIDINQIVIEGAFEKPNLVSLKNGTLTEDEMWLDNNEYLLSEDMIGTIKDIIYKRDLLQTPRQTDEIPNSIKF